MSCRILFWRVIHPSLLVWPTRDVCGVPLFAYFHTQWFFLPQLAAGRRPTQRAPDEDGGVEWVGSGFFGFFLFVCLFLTYRSVSILLLENVSSGLILQRFTVQVCRKSSCTTFTQRHKPSENPQRTLYCLFRQGVSVGFFGDDDILIIIYKKNTNFNFSTPLENLKKVTIALNNITFY